VRRAALILVLALAVLAAGCGGSDDETASGTTASTTTEATTTTTSTATVGADGCTDVAEPAPRKDGGATKPKERLDPEVTYNLVFKTNCGSFTVTLDQAKAPATAASLVSLAKAGFFDNTIFHRIVPDFVIQAGDPTQSGSGGPGYETVDPPPSDTKYDKGVVAMAKTGAEPAGTAGSQFFVVSGPNAATLPPDYAVVGNVTSGMDTVDRINGFGDPNDPNGTPTRPVVIESVTVEQK
jgi:peptidyl-prolyl cis-trans isomerase B (cyclophilin B)